MIRLIPALTALTLTAAPALADRVSVLVFDASGSMWNRVEGDLTRIEVARDVMGDYFGSRDQGQPLSVIAYGHNRRGDCGDIEVIAPMGQTPPADLEARLRALMPRGMTPLTDSLALARDQIPPTAEAADIILVTDGLETCEGDPCALAASLAAEGIEIRAHVVGFGLTRAEVDALSCITDQTGGMLFETNSGAELAQALAQVSAAPPPPEPEPEPETETPALLAQHFVFRDTGTGTPRGLMIWRAEGADGTVLDLGTTEGWQQSLEGRSVQMPLGEWRVIAEGDEGRAEAQFTLTQCCGHHGLPFTGSDMVARIPPVGQVQAGMPGRIPYEITHPGTGHLGGTPYKIIASGPEGSLTRDQILLQDLITSRDPGLRGGAVGAMPVGTYRIVIAVARNNRYDIIAERSFDVVSDPVVNIVAPDHAQPFEEIHPSMDGGYATSYVFNLVDENDRDLLGGYALYYGPGGQLNARLKMPDLQGSYNLVIRRDKEIIARKPIYIGDTPPSAADQAPDQASAQDALPQVPATFRLPPDAPQSDVSWDAVPLDPDMSPEAWAPMDSGPVISGTFESGRWRVTAYAPGEVTLSADVEIFPGQVNDFTVQINASDEEDHAAGGLAGPWRVLAIAPRDAPAGSPTEPMTMVDVTLAANSDGTGYDGHFTPGAMMTGSPGSEAALDSVTEEEAHLFITFSLPGVAPDPFVISLAPYADGFSGTMASGANSLPVIFWPASLPLPALAGMQDQLYGPAPEDHGSLPQEGAAAFACADPVCSWTDPASGVTVALPQGWRVTAPEFQTASATPMQSDLPAMTFTGPEGQELRLNPRQWLDSNGACFETSDLGPLCHFADADLPTVLTAQLIAQMIARGEPSTDPAPQAQAQEQPQAQAAREVQFTLAGVSDGPFVGLEVVLAAGQDPSGVQPGERLHVADGGLSAITGPFIPGNSYSFHTRVNDRDYRAANVLIAPGDGRQSIALAPVYLSYEVTIDLPEQPVIAGSGGYFPVWLTAPEGFQGMIAVHDAYDRDGPALFEISGAQMLAGQDQVLPVPEQPGLYEIRFLDMTGEMFGGDAFEAIAADADAASVAEITVTPSGTTQFGTGCFISADLAGPEGGDYTMTAPVTATSDGRDLRSITDAEAPLQFEIYSFGRSGQSSASLMLRAPCDALVLDFGTPQCSFREGDGIVTRDCPAPVVFAPMRLADGAGTMADAIVQGAAEAAESQPDSPFDPSFIEITPDGISADELLDLLLAPEATE